jgi:hypothetical protein
MFEWLIAYLGWQGNGQNTIAVDPQYKSRFFKSLIFDLRHLMLPDLSSYLAKLCHEKSTSGENTDVHGQRCPQRI